MSGNSDPLKLAGNGWKRVQIDLVKAKTLSLNTPKSENINQLLGQCLGLKEVSGYWPCSGTEVDKLVRLRGSIAHQGTMADKVPRETAAHFRSVIGQTISATDDAL